ncbi:MAG: dethiobiotin synthase [bacterium]|nr:dethiobiotin synthase [bacterium]MDE0667774.1 dethiobiotin synthase [bacterium]
MSRPGRLIVVAGVATEIGKTWVTARVIEELRGRGLSVCARKPVQSYGPEELGATDAEILAAASGEAPSAVCPEHRWYPLPLAPPLAASATGRASPRLAELLAELHWPSPAADFGFVETVGGARSPLAEDADCVDLLTALAADGVVLVAGADLGAINAVRLAADALAGPPLVVFCNRYRSADDVHRGNIAWLAERDGLAVETAVEGLADRLAQLPEGDNGS